MRSVIVIPARYDSTRFPGKPLAMIAGKSLIERVWLLACAASHASMVYIATDDERIKQHAEHFGAQVIATTSSCANGSERILQALQVINLVPDIVINLQGDAVLTPPGVMRTLLQTIEADETIALATPARPMSAAEIQYFRQQVIHHGVAGGTTVVFDHHFRALYFSKYPLPYIRSLAASQEPPPIYQHIGLYAYRYATLERYVHLAPSPLEQAEGLEQLRALENAIPIRIVLVDYQGRTEIAIDNPEDVPAAEAIIKREGELVPACDA